MLLRVTTPLPLAERLIRYDTSHPRRPALPRQDSSRAGSKHATSTCASTGSQRPTRDPRRRRCARTDPRVIFHGHYDVVPGAARAVRAARRGRPADRPRRLRHEGRPRGDDVRAPRRDRPGRRARALRVRARRGVRGDRRRAPPTLLVKRAATWATSRSPASRPTCTSGSRPRACWRMRIVVNGRSAHGSTPWLGDNAVLKAIDVFRRIESLPFTRESSELFDRPVDQPRPDHRRRRAQQGARRVRHGRRRPLPPGPGPGRAPGPGPGDPGRRGRAHVHLRRRRVVSRTNPYVRGAVRRGRALDRRRGR